MGDPHTRGIAAFLARKGVVFSVKRYLVDAMGSMAMGLFASLLIGTILSTLADKLSLDWLKEIASFASAATGSAMAVAIGLALQAPPLVLFSLCAVGYGANSLGGPLGTLICTAVAAELGKIVSKETKVDILVTPTVTIVSGLLIARLAGPGVSAVMTGFGDLIMRATEMHPFFMGIVVSVLMGMILTLPISSAALGIILNLSGLAAGAAVVGCCCNMVGFAVASYRENKIGGLLAQGVGTSMLQVPNIVRKPVIWLPAIISSAILGPVSTLVFHMTSNATGSGMGTAGLVGQIMTYQVMTETLPPVVVLAEIALMHFILPAIISLAVSEVMRKKAWIKFGDMKLDVA